MLNKSKGNMYDFITHTWNTIKGECSHGCTYCYMKRFGKQNPVHFDKNELKTDLGSGNFIFVGSSCDMWAEDIPDKWICDTLEHLEQYDNKYLFQTKNPNRIYDYINMGALVSNCVVCTTIETNRYYPEIMGDSPTPQDRALATGGVSWYVPTYVTIEPIMNFDMVEMINLIEQCNPEQVNIGADSGRNNLPEPNATKINALIEEFEKFTVVKKKNNLKRLLGES